LLRPYKFKIKKATMYRAPAGKGKMRRR